MTPLTKKIIIYTSLGILTIFSLALITYHLAYQNKIYPGIKILGVNVGNLTKQEATTILSAQLKDFLSADLSISAGDLNKTSQLSDLGLSPDVEKTVNYAYSLGREKNQLLAFNNKFRAWQRGINLSYSLHTDQAKLDDFISGIETEILAEPKDAQITLVDNNPVVQESANGVGLNVKEALTNLRSRISHLRPSIPLPTQTLYPQVSTAGAKSAFEKIKTILDKNFVFKYETQSFPISKSGLLGLFSFGNQKSKALPVADLGIGGFDLTVENINAEKPVDSYDLTTSLSDEKVKGLLENIANQVDRPSQDARFVFKDGKVENFTPHATGLEVDQEKSLSNLEKALESQTESIALVVKVSEPAVQTGAVNDLGIKELLGRGTSKFVGSIPNRIFNISLAASRANGTLVPPGEIFSAYKAIGEVEGTTGYKEAYVINNNRTELDWGGGVCQVSTTMFRAALNSGLPIVERNPHAYRVGYYEQMGDPGWGKPGVDAAVFFPQVDFKFKNDTQHHILVQSIFDGKAQSLVFEIYGTSDGRKVSISTPVISDQTKPPDPLYQDDPTLPKGTTKQVDWSAWGATTTFSRTVTRGGETLTSGTFYSKYRPWRAVYLVGTKEETPAPAPTPEPTPTT